MRLRTVPEVLFIIYNVLVITYKIMAVLGIYRFLDGISVIKM